jgi:hypothetical protein
MQSIRLYTKVFALVSYIPRLNLGNGASLALPSLVYGNVVLLDVFYGCQTWCLFYGRDIG